MEEKCNARATGLGRFCFCMSLPSKCCGADPADSFTEAPNRDGRQSKDVLLVVSPLDCALTKNAPVCSLECILTKLLDLKSRVFILLRKRWGYQGPANMVRYPVASTEGIAETTNVPAYTIASSNEDAPKPNAPGRGGLPRYC